MKKYFKTLSYCLLLCSLLFTVKTNALNYYWVGGSGNWSQYATHWATTSGGSTFQTQVPQSVDNVYFDANSFTASGQSVNIDQTIVNCYTMDWTGATHKPAMSGSYSNSLYIYGSLTFITNMTNSFGGQVHFQATTGGQTITSALQPFNTYLYFDGVGGVWTLLDSMTVKDALGQASISLVNGTLNTNDQGINTGGFSFGNYSSGPTMNMGSSFIDIEGSICHWTVGTGGLTLNAGTSTIYFNGGLNGNQFTGGAQTYHDLIFTSPGNCAINDGNTFNNVTMACSGYINTNCTFNNLTFKAGSTYNLGGTQTILNSLTANGNCGALVYIQATSGTATIKKTSGSITVDYANITGIKATGGATFTATNSVDGGNNTGWTINTLSSKNLYWVGNGGNWSDGNHWSLISGGAGSGCSPTPVDNVYFDANSFNTSGAIVTLDAATANCNDMDWTGTLYNPTLTGSYSNSLYIYGSLTFVPGITNSMVGGIWFVASTSGKKVTSNSVAFQTVYFNKSGGVWTLQDSLTAKNLDLGSGTLNSNNQNINIGGFQGGGFGGSGNNAAVFNLGSSTITVRNYDGWHMSSSGAPTINAGTSHIIYTANVNGFSVFWGGQQTYYNVDFMGVSVITYVDGNTFNNVFLAGSASIDGSYWGSPQTTSTYNNLTLSAGGTYTFHAGSTQNINGSLIANGSCSGLITLNSDAPGTQAILKQTSGNVTISYLSLKDIKATGGAVFTANNSIDAGDNSGWIINASSPKNLYWVGGTGNWSDGSHWSLTSGGAGSGCTPTPADNVFFDNLSFSSSGQSVNVDATTATCNDMNWTGVTNNPSLTGTHGNNNSLNVYGSMTLVPGMTYSYLNFLNFKSTTTGKTITTAGRTFSENMTFDGIGGGWTLMDDLTLTQSCCFGGEGRIEIDNGTLNSNNKKISALALYANAGGLILGSSVVTLSYGNGECWGIHDGFSLDAGTSSIICTGDGSYTEFYYYSSGSGSFTYYDVSFTGTSENVEVIGNSRFHSLSFKGDVQIRNSISVGSIYFNDPGHTITFDPATTLSVDSDGQLYAVGTGSYPIRIQSRSVNNLYTFYKTAGSVCLDYVRLSDSKATGGATFNAGANSQDLGGNSGWSFTGGGGGNPTVSITSSQPNGICNGSNVTFTAVPGSGGTATFDWHVNSTSKQNTSSTTYSTSSLSNNDSVYCIMTVSASCLSSNTATSNKIPITLVSNVTPSVSISPIQPSVCSGTQLTFTATPLHGGTTPSYQWQKNGAIVGVDSVQFSTSTLHNNDTITCILTSNENCATPTTATSNKAIAVVNPSTLSGTVTAVPSAVCSGQSSQLSVTGSQGTLQWQSSPNGTLFTDIPAASSTSYNASNITQTTYFRVKASSTCGVDSSDTPIAVHIASSYTAGTISAPHNALCDGATDTFAVTGNSGAIQWQSSSTSANFTDIAGEVNSTYLAQPSQTTYYRVFAGSGACADSSAPFALSVHPLPAPPVLSVTPDTIICASDSAHICAPDGFSAYLWNDNSTAACTYARNAGGYWVNVTDGNGCSNSSSHASITVYPVSSVAIVANGDTLSSFNGKAYQWYANDTVITGANNSYYVSPGKGSYAVEITDTNGCKARSSSIALAINDLSTDAPFNIYPNPANNEVFIVINSATSYSDICLINMLGQEVKRLKLQNNAVGNLKLDLAGVPAGVFELALYKSIQLVGNKLLIKK